MPFQKSKNIFVATLFVATSIWANEESILSKNRLDIFDYSKEQNEQNSSQLKKDWINPITYKYSHTYGEDNLDSKKSYISINQPIFKSGGIYSAIKYASYLKKYSDLDIDLQRKNLIKEATVLLFNIHRAAYSIKKQNYLLKNAQIDIQRKKEQVLNGFIDTSFLDNAILQANLRKYSLVELKYSRLNLINSFNNIASGDYKSFELPQLKLINKKDFINNNLEIKKYENDIEVKDKFHFMTIAKYLPTINATYDYTKYHDIKNSSSITKGDLVENYGINVTVPFDVRIYNDIQSKKIDYLKAKNNLENIKLEQKNFFKTKIEKIKMIEERINIALEDYDLYNSLLEVIIQEKNAELKTQSDVDTLLNSQKIKSIESKLFKIDIQIELLEIYSKIEG